MQFNHIHPLTYGAHGKAIVAFPDKGQPGVYPGRPDVLPA